MTGDKEHNLIKCALIIVKLWWVGCIVFVGSWSTKLKCIPRLQKILDGARDEGLGLDMYEERKRQLEKIRKRLEKKVGSSAKVMENDIDSDR